MDKILGFSYRMENHAQYVNNSFKSNSDKYADAVDELIKHVDKTFPDGGELTIKQIFIYKLTNKK